MATSADFMPRLTPEASRNRLIARAESDFFGKLECFLPPRVDILVVIDGSGAFDRSSSFGLGRMIDVRRSDPGWWVRFNLTTAHRGALTASQQASM